MQVRRVQLQNFRGVKEGTVLLDGHCLLAGSNSAGKSTICDALGLVLGPERMARRPVIDEYDFYGAQYQEREGELPEVRIEVILTNLSEVAQRRFGSHLRLWSRQTNDFLDLGMNELDEADTGEWCLPVIFCGRYDPQEDDFAGGTFFAHPENLADEPSGDDTAAPGDNLKPFTRADKRHCGFLYLRPNRTGNRALTFQRGSLLDTIVRLEAELAGPLWESTLRNLDQVTIAAADSGFDKIRTEIHERINRFLSLGETPDPVDFRASEITREHLREVLRLFIATQPSTHSVPFNRLSTGSLNLLVFALLTYIAELKGDKSVIFAIEEPEIALPPHAQRRLVDFVLKNMGQVIVTSHSPYVIEKFEPSRTVVITRDGQGALTSRGVTLPPDFKPSKYRVYRRQFAEAILARAVLVVEGATEAALFPAVSDILEADPTVPDYVHIDLAGVTVFDAQSDVNVPLFAPVFKALNKPVYGIHDQPTTPLAPALVTKAADFTHYEELAHKSVEKLLVAEVPVGIQRSFLLAVAQRDDYPSGCARLAAEASDEEVRALASKVLVARKADGYGALLITACKSRSDVPAVLADFLLAIDSDLRSVDGTETTGDKDESPTGVPDED